MPKLPQILAVPEKAALYGSSRLGSRKERVCMNCTIATLPAELQGISYVIRGEKSYELSNHLGNVLSVVSDRREAGSCTDSLVDFYYADGRSVSDYYPFGMAMDSRTQSAGGYRWGFNGQEKDDEIAGEGNSYTAEFWQYDSRLGRRWNVDPVDKPWMSSYHAFSNKPITNIDPNGADDGWIENKQTGKLTWDANVNTPREFANSEYSSDYSYVGLEGYGFDIGGTDQFTHFKSDGTSSTVGIALPEFNLESTGYGSVADHLRNTRDRNLSEGDLVKALEYQIKIWTGRTSDHMTEQQGKKLMYGTISVVTGVFGFSVAKLGFDFVRTSIIVASGIDDMLANSDGQSKLQAATNNHSGVQLFKGIAAGSSINDIPRVLINPGNAPSFIGGLGEATNLINNQNNSDKKER